MHIKYEPSDNLSTTKVLWWQVGSSGWLVVGSSSFARLFTLVCVLDYWFLLSFQFCHKTTSVRIILEYELVYRRRQTNEELNEYSTSTRDSEARSAVLSAWTVLLAYLSITRAATSPSNMMGLLKFSLLHTNPLSSAASGASYPCPFTRERTSRTAGLWVSVGKWPIVTEHTMIFSSWCLTFISKLALFTETSSPEGYLRIVHDVG